MSKLLRAFRGCFSPKKGSKQLQCLQQELICLLSLNLEGTPSPGCLFPARHVKIPYYCQCVISSLNAKDAAIASHSPAIARAVGVGKGLRHLKRGLFDLYSTKTVIFCDPPTSPGGGPLRCYRPMSSLHAYYLISRGPLA